MENLRSRHAEETQQVLSEFSRAQAILKDKITDLTTLLVKVQHLTNASLTTCVALDYLTQKHDKFILFSI